MDACCNTHAGSTHVAIHMHEAFTYCPVGAEALQHKTKTTSVAEALQHETRTTIDDTLLQVLESVREPFANWLVELGKCNLWLACAQLAASSVDAA